MPKILIQAEAADADRLAVRDKPTVADVMHPLSPGVVTDRAALRYTGIVTSRGGQFLELHLEVETARRLSADLLAKLADLEVANPDTARVF